MMIDPDEPEERRGFLHVVLPLLLFGAMAACFVYLFFASVRMMIDFIAAF